MKLGPVTKLDNNVKKFDDDFMSENCDVIAIFPIYGQSGAFWKPDSGRIVAYFINSTLLSYKN